MQHKKPTISQIVTTAYCEQKAIFDINHKPDHRTFDKDQKAARAKAEEGAKAHTALEKSGNQIMRGQKTDMRCFIASAVYGADARETNLLRAWRDNCLNKTAFGRTFVAVYYWISPAIATILKNNPRVAKVVKKGLSVWIRFIEGK